MIYLAHGEFLYRMLIDYVERRHGKQLDRNKNGARVADTLVAPTLRILLPEEPMPLRHRVIASSLLCLGLLTWSRSSLADRRLPLVSARAKYDHGRREVTASLPLLIFGLPFTVAATALLIKGGLGVGGDSAGVSTFIGGLISGPAVVTIAAGSVLLADGLLRMHRAEDALEAPPQGQRYQLPEDPSRLRRWRSVGIANLVIGAVAAPVGAALIPTAVLCTSSREKECHGELFPAGLILASVGVVMSAVGGALLIDTHLRSRWQRHLNGLAVSPSGQGAWVHASLRF